MKNFWLELAAQEEDKETRRLAQCAKSVIEDRFHQYYDHGSDYKIAYQAAATKGRDFLQMLKDGGSIYRSKIRHGRHGIKVAIRKDPASDWVWSDEAVLKP